MTTWTTEDREALEKGLEFYKQLNSSPPHIVNSGASYEPIPFAGIVAIQDKEDTEQMLRHQLHIVQAECQRLQTILRQHGIQY
jgi:hypothetical protein